MSWGQYNRALELASTAWGDNNSAFNDFATVWGRNNFSGGYGGTVWGLYNDGIGSYSTVSGTGNIAKSQFEFVVGTYCDTVSGANPLFWEQDDYVFVVGNGRDGYSRNNALSVLKNGDVTLDRRLILDGYNASEFGGSGSDDAVIYAAPESPGSDLFIAANDEIHLFLDRDNNESGFFKIFSGSGVEILKLDEFGNLHITGNIYTLGSSSLGSNQSDAKKIDKDGIDQIYLRLEKEIEMLKKMIENNQS